MNYGIVLGYHGCSRATVQAVLNGDQEHLIPSNSDREWLGKGVYFWENSYDLALKWAEKYCSDDPDVLGAIIVPGQCLDLTDSECNEALAVVGAYFENLYDRLNKKPPPPNNVREGYHPYDCALINTFREIVDAQCEDIPVETVRAAFQEGEHIAGSTFRKLNHIQWAVPNPAKNILGYFRPSELARMPRFPQLGKLNDSLANAHH